MSTLPIGGIIAGAVIAISIIAASACFIIYRLTKYKPSTTGPGIVPNYYGAEN